MTNSWYNVYLNNVKMCKVLADGPKNAKIAARSYLMSIGWWEKLLVNLTARRKV